MKDMGSRQSLRSEMQDAINLMKVMRFVTNMKFNVPSY